MYLKDNRALAIKYVLNDRHFFYYDAWSFRWLTCIIKFAMVEIKLTDHWLHPWKIASSKNVSWLYIKFYSLQQSVVNHILTMYRYINRSFKLCSWIWLIWKEKNVNKHWSWKLKSVNQSNRKSYWFWRINSLFSTLNTSDWAMWGGLPIGLSSTRPIQRYLSTKTRNSRQGPAKRKRDEDSRLTRQTPRREPDW